MKNEKIDRITIDVPLFIRMLEYAREDAKTDMDLHSVTQNILKLSKEKNMLTMTDYKHIVKSKKQETDEQTMASSSGSYESGMSSPMIKRPIKTIPNFKTKKGEFKEATDASSSGAFDVPFLGSSPKGNKDPLAINGPNSIKTSRAVKDPKFPKWGGPGSTFIKIKEKCKKFPYCNQGDINAIEPLRESINYVSKKYGIPKNEVEKLVLSQLNENGNELTNVINKMLISLNNNLEQQIINKKNMYDSLKLIGDGNIKYNDYSGTFKYSENVCDDIELVVYGFKSPNKFSYEIRIFKGETQTTYSEFGKSTHKENLFNYITELTDIKNINVISQICNVIRNYFCDESI